MTAARPRRTGYPGYNTTQTRAPETAEEARRLARVALCAWGLDDAAETAALLLSELVTNAVRHAHGPAVRIIVDRPADDRVYVAVIDRAPQRLPEMRTPAPDDVNGRGLVLVDELADRWGYDLMGSGARAWGKRVWAEMKVSG
ncbi:ATP-binding protein [Streptomyces sp. NPDC056930]|uniref:ATP-binding protein n=1 Tax=Streptomyces sp. NPDC056930 TaxID=3345967 RepID=UPI0036438993